MALPQAILAVLVQSPTTGYDLAKKFDGSVGFFWKATHQQIYRELAKLEEQGWVENEAIVQPGRPEKKELRTWMQQPTLMSPPKEDILVKMFAGYLVPQETILAQLETHRQLHQERLSIYECLAEKYFAKPEELRKDDKFVYLTLRNGLMYERYWIDWCQEAIVTLHEI
jgi:benzoyl-CoA reductase/2-hydroxyglutaryl-CoA dehydratase subunit BcrC/BadD/HgdB